MQKMGVKIFGLGFLLLFSWSTIGIAADYPEKPIRLIIPFSAGSGNDSTARALLPALEKALGQRVLIECIPAGSTKVGTMELLKAKPDGYTLVLSTQESWVALYYSKTYDSKIWEQMVPIAATASAAYGFVEVRTESPYKTWADFVKGAKENPGKLTCAGPAAGGVTELIHNEITKAAGIKTIYVPFAGGAKSGIALYGGHTDYRIGTPSTASVMLQAGKSRGIAISTDERLAGLPDVPTFKELGIGGSIYLTGGFWGPPKLPANVVNTLAKSINKAKEDPGFKKSMDKLYNKVDFLTPDQVKGRMLSFDKQFGAKLAEMYK